MFETLYHDNDYNKYLVAQQGIILRIRNESKRSDKACPIEAQYSFAATAQRVDFQTIYRTVLLDVKTRVLSGLVYPDRSQVSSMLAQPFWRLICLPL